MCLVLGSVSTISAATQMSDPPIHDPPRWVKRFKFTIVVLLLLFVLHLVVMWLLGHSIADMIGHIPPASR